MVTAPDIRAVDIYFDRDVINSMWSLLDRAPQDDEDSQGLRGPAPGRIREAAPVASTSRQLVLADPDALPVRCPAAPACRDALCTSGQALLRRESADHRAERNTVLARSCQNPPLVNVVHPASRDGSGVEVAEGDGESIGVGRARDSILCKVSVGTAIGVDQRLGRPHRPV